MRLADALLHPLDGFYATKGMPLPLVEAVRPVDVPAPVHGLVAHEGELTDRLAAHVGAEVALRVLTRHREDARYSREVVLETLGRAAVVAAVTVELDALPPTLSQRVLAEDEPLGRIVRGHLHSRCPVQALRVRADAFLCATLALDAAVWLYGRRRTLVDCSGRAVAELVELIATPHVAAAGRALTG